jgi:pilus assembly protein Flp/PilA
MVAAVKRFWNDESGATAVEYALMVALIAVAIIVAVTALGTSLRHQVRGRGRRDRRRLTPGRVATRNAQ